MFHRSQDKFKSRQLLYKLNLLPILLLNRNLDHKPSLLLNHNRVDQLSLLEELLKRHHHLQEEVYHHQDHRQLNWNLNHQSHKLPKLYL